MSKPSYNHEGLGRMIDREFCQPINQLVPHDFFKPFQNIFQPLHHMLRQTEQIASSMKQLRLNEASTVASDDEKFQINVDVHHFAPDEINVKVVDGYITVEGKHEEKRDEHGFITRQFLRRYPLPQGCLPDTVECKLSSDGVLTVSAPKVLVLPSSGERIVPVIQTGPVKRIANNSVE